MLLRNVGWLNGLHGVISQEIEFNSIQYHLTTASFSLFVFYSFSITLPLLLLLFLLHLILIIFPFLLFFNPFPFACSSFVFNCLGRRTAHAWSEGDAFWNEARGITTSPFFIGCACRQDLGWENVSKECRQNLRRRSRLNAGSVVFDCYQVGLLPSSRANCCPCFNCPLIRFPHWKFRREQQPEVV